MRWRLVFVALLAVTAGCSALEGGTETPTLSPAPVPTDAPESGPGSQLVEGVWADGRIDTEKLARAHRTALENRSFRWLSTRNWSGSVGETTTALHSYRLIVYENATVYYTDSDQVADRRTEEIYARYSEYANGTHEYTRARAFTQPGSKFELSRAQSSQNQVIGRTTEPIVQYLAVQNTTVERVEIDGQPRYRITGERAAGVLGTQVDNYSVRATVTPAGLVTEVTARYRLLTGNSNEHVSYHYEFQQLGNVTVSQPEWLPEAKARIANGTNDFPSER